jgi:hypothetical protein
MQLIAGCRADRRLGASGGTPEAVLLGLLALLWRMYVCTRKVYRSILGGFETCGGRVWKNHEVWRGRGVVVEWKSEQIFTSGGEPGNKALKSPLVVGKRFARLKLPLTDMRGEGKSSRNQQPSRRLVRY